MSHFGRNIKKIRTAKKISQTAFADLFNLKRGSIGAYEEGRAEAKIDTIIEIAAYFKLSIEQLICKDLTFNEIYHIAELRNIFIDSDLDKKVEAVVPIVRIEDRSEFINKYNNQSYLSRLQTLRLPNTKPKSIAFELADFDFDSFDYLLGQGDIVIAEKIIIDQMGNSTSNQNFLIIENNNFQWVRSFSDGGIVEFRSYNPHSKNNPIYKDGIEAIYLINQFIISKLDMEQSLRNNWQTIENKLDRIMKSMGIL